MNTGSRKNSRKTKETKSSWRGTAYLAILLFLLLYAMADLRWQLPRWVGAGYLLASFICLVLFAWDKGAALAGRRRIPEKNLLVWGLLGGWPGAILVIAVLRHKIQKTEFLVRFWFVAALNVAIFIAFASPVFTLWKTLFF